MKKFRFIVDPGHAWLEVPTKVLDQMDLTFKISKYSYLSHDGRLAYLEEDCDMCVFLQAWAKKRGYDVSAELASELFADHYETDYHDAAGAPECFVRSLPGYGDPVGSFHRRAS